MRTTALRSGTREQSCNSTCADLDVRLNEWGNAPIRKGKGANKKHDKQRVLYTFSCTPVQIKDLRLFLCRERFPSNPPQPLHIHTSTLQGRILVILPSAAKIVDDRV